MRKKSRDSYRPVHPDRRKLMKRVSKQGEGVAIPCICGGCWSRHHVIKTESCEDTGLGMGR